MVVGKVAELRIKETATRSFEKLPHLHLQPHLFSLCLVEKKSSLYIFRSTLFLAEVVYFSIPVNAKAMPAGVLDFF